MDDAMWILLPVLIGAYLLIAPALGIAAFVRGNRQREEIARLRLQLQGLVARLERMSAPPAPQPEEPVVPEAAPKEEPAAPRETATPVPAEPPPAQTAAHAAPQPRPAPDSVAGWRRLEESITSQWLVWLGALTLALAGVFLVKYSIERGWLGPAVRVTLGFLLGLALTGAGEWLRRRPLQRAIAALRPNYVPPALTAAGLFTAFASVFAAYGLYGLLSPLFAFALLAALAFAAVALAVLQGPLIAVLGLVGGFATPLLVTTGTHAVWELFGYLLVLVAAGLWVVRYMAWWWLAWWTLAGAAFWALLWFGAMWRTGDAVPLGLFLLALCGLCFFVRRGQGASVELVTWNKALATLSRPDQIAWAAAATVAVLVFMLVRLDAYGPASLLTLAAFSLLVLAVGYREAVFDALGPLAALVTALLMAAWHLPKIITRSEPLYIIGGVEYGRLPGPLVPPELVPYLGVVAAFALLFALGGFIALWGARRPALWAGLSAATPVALLAVAYWRIEAFQIDLKWSAVALAVAGLNVAAAARVKSYETLRGFDLVLGAYAAAAVAGLSLALVMALEQAWLTVALSLQLPALAWIHDRLRLPPLRRVAEVVAGVVLIRLVLNYHVLDYPLGGQPGFNWLLYGYGIPAAAFWWAGRRFRAAGEDRLTMMLEAGALAFVTLLVTFQLRNIVAGSLTSPDYRLLEQSLQSIAWLALAAGCLVQYRRHGRVVLLWGWRLLAGLAAGQTLLLQLLVYNPLWSGDAVGPWPVLNVLLLAYVVPGLFAVYFARALQQAGHARLAAAAGVAGLLLVFVYVSLEVRHLFQGPVLAYGVTSDAEMYSYSLAWICYALALLALGIRQGSLGLRYASLAVLLIAIGKVFLVDMAALETGLRVISFFGLGLSLVGVSYLYQRFVFPPRGGPPAGGQAAGSPAV